MNKHSHTGFETINDGNFTYVPENRVDFNHNHDGDDSLTPVFVFGVDIYKLTGLILMSLSAFTVGLGIAFLIKVALHA